MANIISNIIRLGGENPDLEHITKFVKSDNLIFDFNRIIPVPSNAKDDYRWKIAHWGTASNTSSDNTECEDYEFRFWTRWTAPIQVIAELASMFPDVEFTHIYADEQFGSNCGYIEYRNGVKDLYFSPDTNKEYEEIYNICW